MPPKDLDGDGAAGRKDYLIFARELGGIDENYIPNPLIIDDLLAFADVDGNGEVEAADYLLAYATLYEKEISECLTNGISLKTSMQAADINGDGTVTEADKEIGIDFALSGSSTYPIGETVANTYPCVVAENRILVSAQYAYNPSGLRSAKTVGGSTKYFVYNGMNIVYEYEDSISDGVVYCYGLNRTHNSDGEIYVYNAHGDTVQLVKDNEVVASYTYDAFGNLTSELCDNDNAFLYCSEYFDAETKTYYLRARYYNPANGRFTQEDPIRDGLNWYTYCSNNPVTYIDPSGLTIVISNITSKENEIFVNLQLLTDDTLDVDLETGIVSYTASDNVTRATSTALIRELIDNVDFKCTIVHYPENRTDYKTEFRNPDNYLSAEIGHDPSLVVKTWSYVEGEGFSMRNLPPEISLGHELIHVIRRMRGYERNQNDIGYYLGGPQPGQTLLRVNKPEELETSGIDYYKVIGGDWNNVVKVDSSQFDYTENKLRAEYDALHANDPGYILLGTRAAY